MTSGDHKFFSGLGSVSLMDRTHILLKATGSVMDWSPAGSVAQGSLLRRGIITSSLSNSCSDKRN